MMQVGKVLNGFGAFLCGACGLLAFSFNDAANKKQFDALHAANEKQFIEMSILILQNSPTSQSDATREKIRDLQSELISILENSPTSESDATKKKIRILQLAMEN